MGQAASLLPNALGPTTRPVDNQKMRQLTVLAAQDGHIDKAEAAYLKALPATPTALNLRDTFLAKPANAEVVARRASDPTFDAKVAALKTHAKPGDLIFWKSAETATPWKTMRAAYGPYMHVSVVLGDGKLMDPYWPDGVTVSTPEAAVAKSFTRIKASDMVIARPSKPLSAAQLAQLTKNAYAAQGQAYALLTPLDKPADTASSCSRTARDLFKSVGVELAPAEQRMYQTVISPGDLIQGFVAHIDKAGAVSTVAPADFKPGRPDGLLAKVLGAVDALGARFGGLMQGAYKFQDKLTAALMTQMADGHMKFHA